MAVDIEYLTELILYHIVLSGASDEAANANLAELVRNIEGLSHEAALSSGGVDGLGGVRHLGRH